MSHGASGRDQLRASDADRERIVAQLRENTAEGRLSMEEFEERMQAAYAAKTYADLGQLVRDLPVDLAAESKGAVPPPDGPVDLADYAPVRRPGWRSGQVRAWIGVSGLLVGIWLISCIGSLIGGHPHFVYFWPIYPIAFWGLGLWGRAFRGGQAGGGGRRYERHAERMARLADRRGGAFGPGWGRSADGTDEERTQRRRERYRYRQW